MPAETHSSREPLDRDGILAVLRAQASAILECDEEAVVPAARFVDDLGADSLGSLELAQAMEEELGERTVGFRVDDDDLADLVTVSDALDYLAGRLEAR